MGTEGLYQLKALLMATVRLFIRTEIEQFSASRNCSLAIHLLVMRELSDVKAEKSNSRLVILSKGRYSEAVVK